jgi:hypothetical protein
MSTDWDPVEALRSLTVENAFDGSESPHDLAKRLLGENLPMSVLAICHMATYSPNETIRFNAAKYVVDRTLGPAERMATPDGKHAWEDIYEHVITEAENYVNNPGSNDL